MLITAKSYKCIFIPIQHSFGFPDKNLMTFCDVFSYAYNNGYATTPGTDGTVSM